MLIIYHDVIDADKCDMFIQEHDANPNKHVLNEVDTFFDDRVLFLQRMNETAQSVGAILAQEIGLLLSRHFKIDLVPETVSTVRWSAGESMAAHRDGQNPQTGNRSHSVVLYLNDQPEGGEIVFPELGTVITPRRALMVAYEKTLLHAVRPVIHPRYTLTLWYSDKPECSIFRSQA